MRFYFDHNASTPIHPLVLETFLEVNREVFGNASSIHHFGQAAKHRLESARRSVAKLIGAGPREVVFTSGGTESDNLAILGAVRGAYRTHKHVITTLIEHPAVLAACGQLAREGVAVTFLPVGSSGVVDPDDVRRAMRPETVLVSVMHANNETGAIQPLEEIAAITREQGVLFHSDGVQAAGRLPIDVRALGVDLYSLSGHKMNAPKGGGALFVREKVALNAVQHGGHQERERRAGTENVAAIAAFGIAAELACAMQPGAAGAMKALRDQLESGIFARVTGASLNAGQGERLPNTSNIRFASISGEALVIALDLAGFAVSSGSACASGSIEASHVLLGMGLREPEARSSVRFSVGLGNTAEEVDGLIEAVHVACLRLASSRIKRQDMQHV